MAIIPRRRGKAAESYHFLAETLRELEFHLRGRIEESGLIPTEWREIATQKGAMPKVKVNLWIEGDVVKFFKGTGQGWSTRMAEVLRTFVLSRRAGLLSGAEGVDYTPMEGEERRHRIEILHELSVLNAEAQAELRASRRKPAPAPEAEEGEKTAAGGKAGIAVADMWRIIEELRDGRSEGNEAPE